MSKPASRTSSNSSENSFGQLWLARDVAALADWVIFIALLCYSAIFSESPSTLGMLIAIMLAPRFVLWPVVSRVVTWKNATAFGIVAQIMRATVLLSAFLLEREDGVQSVMILAGAYAVAGPFLGAAQRALFAATVQDGQRPPARTALLNTWLLTLAVGPAFGYAIYGAGGLRSGAAATIVALFVSAALLLRARPRRAADPAAEATSEMLVGFAPLPVGLVAAFRDPALQQIAAIQIIASVLAGGVGVLEAAYTTNGLYIGIENVGILMASQGFGAAIAGVGYRQVGKRYPLNTVIATGLALLGGGELGLAISTGVQAGTGFAAIIGAGIGLLVISMADLAQEIVSSPDSRRLPVFSVRTIVDGAILLSAAIAAPLCQSISPRFTLVLTGTLIWVLALYSFGAVPALSEQSRWDDTPVYPR